jgi:hypothetical protein
VLLKFFIRDLVYPGSEERRIVYFHVFPGQLPLAARSENWIRRTPTPHNRKEAECINDTISSPERKSVNGLPHPKRSMLCVS